MNKKTALLFFLCLLINAACMTAKKERSDTLATISIVDRNGMTEVIAGKDRLRRYEKVNFLQPQPYQKVMRVYARDEKGDIRASITSYHPNGQIKQDLDVVNGRAYGYYREWHANGTLKLEGYIIGGNGDLDTAAENSWLFDGESRAWDEEGNLIAYIPYYRGALDGESLYYHANGKLWKSVPFVSGAIDGTYKIYCNDGSKLETVAYSNGERHGEGFRYWPDGSIAAKEVYSNECLVQGRYYDIQGNCICSIDDGRGVKALFGKEQVSELHNYQNGIQEGLVQVLDERGNVYNSYYIKDGDKHGEEIEYYPLRPGQKKPLPRLSVNWFKGQVQGKVRTWYPSGTMESQREISENEKNGIATAWYEDGSLMLIEEYELETLKSGKYFKKGEKVTISQVRDGKGVATLYDSLGNFLRKVDYLNGRPLP